MFKIPNNPSKPYKVFFNSCLGKYHFNSSFASRDGRLHAVFRVKSGSPSAAATKLICGVVHSSHEEGEKIVYRLSRVSEEAAGVDQILWERGKNVRFSEKSSNDVDRKQEVIPSYWRKG